MNNEPVAWMDEDENVVFEKCKVYPIPLYTHPAKTQSHTETAVKILNYLGYSQEPSREEGADARRDKLVEIISQSNPAKTLTDEEMYELLEKYQGIELCKAVLRKAQEK